MRELTTQQLKDERARVINTIDWCQVKIVANQKRLEWIENYLLPVFVDNIEMSQQDAAELVRPGGKHKSDRQKLLDIAMAPTLTMWHPYGGTHCRVSNRYLPVNHQDLIIHRDFTTHPVSGHTYTDCNFRFCKFDPEFFDNNTLVDCRFGHCEGMRVYCPTKHQLTADALMGLTVDRALMGLRVDRALIVVILNQCLSATPRTVTRNAAVMEVVRYAAPPSFEDAYLNIDKVISGEYSSFTWPSSSKWETITISRA